MEKTTSKRYEATISWVQRSQPAVRRQEARILDDETNASMVADVVECEKTSYFSNWKERDLEDFKHLDNLKTIDKERHALKADRIKVRRELLEKMLEEEEKQYKDELEVKGLIVFSIRK